MSTKISKSEAEWRAELTPEQYEVLREKGTERPFTGEYYKTKDPGVYKCAARGNELFDSLRHFTTHDPTVLERVFVFFSRRLRRGGNVADLEPGVILQQANVLLTDHAGRA